MDKKELIELLGLTCWHDLKGWTEYPLMLDEREDYHGKQLEYLDIKPSDYEEGKINPKMMSVGLHCRLIGRPGRVQSLKKFLDYALKFNDVWICKRIDIAKHWIKNYPS